MSKKIDFWMGVSAKSGENVEKVNRLFNSVLFENGRGTI